MRFSITGKSYRLCVLFLIILFLFRPAFASSEKSGGGLSAIKAAPLHSLVKGMSQLSLSGAGGQVKASMPPAFVRRVSSFSRGKAAAQISPAGVVLASVIGAAGMLWAYDKYQVWPATLSDTRLRRIAAVSQKTGIGELPNHMKPFLKRDFNGWSTAVTLSYDIRSRLRNSETSPVYALINEALEGTWQIPPAGNLQFPSNYAYTKCTKDSCGIFFRIAAYRRHYEYKLGTLYKIQGEDDQAWGVSLKTDEIESNARLRIVHARVVEIENEKHLKLSYFDHWGNYLGAEYWNFMQSGIALLDKDSE